MGAPYLLFNAATRDKVVKANPGLSKGQVSKKIAKRWESLDDATKAPFIRCGSDIYLTGRDAGKYKLHRALGYNRFETTFTRVPKEYRVVAKHSDDYNELVHDSCANLPDIHAFPWGLWIEKARPNWLTIADINTLSSNQSIEVVLFDSVGDLVAHNVDSRIYTPLVFFKKLIATFTKTHDLCGKLRLRGSSPFEIELSVYFRREWCTVEKAIRSHTHVGGKHGKHGPVGPIRHTVLPLATPVGIFCPMIRCDTLLNLPDVYSIP